MRERIARVVVLFFAVVGVFLMAAAGLSLVTMLLWNALVPVLFKGPSVTFGQALGLLLLSHILFRSSSPWRPRPGWGRERWRQRFEEKLGAMTPEERERVRARWGRHCGWASEPRPESKANEAEKA